MPPLHRLPRVLSIVSATLAAAFIAVPALADRAAVEAVMRDIEKAVLAGDPDAYLKLILPDDPVFLTEQQNWAADFKRAVPDTFTLSIVEPAPDAGEDDNNGEPGRPASRRRLRSIPAPVFDETAGFATFEMAIDWTIAFTDSGRDHDLDRSVSFPARFVRAGADGDVRWLYAGEDWIIIDSEPDPDHPNAAPNRAFCFVGFEEAARSAVAVLPEIRRHVDDGFQVTNPKVQEVKVYASMRHLQASIYLSYWDSLSGWNEPGESIKILAPRRASRDSLRRLLAHEYGHVATFEMGPRANEMPWWTLEGVAELAAEKWGSRASADSAVRRWAAANSLADWELLADFHKTPERFMGHVYKQGHHMVGYISDRWGRQGRNDWLRAMAEGKSIDEASRNVLGLSFADLDSQWRGDLPSQPAEGDGDAQ